jgi:putative SOS response-associated peptidase YedK
MCGRYDNLIPRDAYSALFRAVRVPRSNFPPRYNVAPTDQIPIVRIDPRDGERELTMARWGLIPFWMKEKPKVGEPNPLVGGVHDRMPVMLLPEDYDAWLASTTEPEDLRSLLRPYDESLMEAYAVSRKVNSVKNDTEECIEPIDDDQG